MAGFKEPDFDKSGAGYREPDFDISCAGYREPDFDIWFVIFWMISAIYS